MRKKLACLMLGVALVGSLFTGCEKDTTKEADSSLKTNEEEKASENETKKEEVYNVLYNTGEEYLEEGEWKYYASGDSLWREKLDDSYKQEIADNLSYTSRYGESYYSVRPDMHIIGDWIYYMAESNTEEEQFAIYRVKKDATSEPEEIFVHDGKRDDLDWIRSISSDGGYLYYSAKEGIVKMNLDGTEDKIIFYSNDVGDILEIRNGYIYYKQYDIDGRKKGISRVNLDGIEHKEIGECDIWMDGKMYYVNANKIYMSDQDNDTVQVLYESTYDELKIYGVKDKYICCYEATYNDSGNYYGYHKAEELDKATLFWIDFTSLSKYDIMQFPCDIDGRDEQFYLGNVNEVTSEGISFWVYELGYDPDRPVENGSYYERYECVCTYSFAEKKIIDMNGHYETIHVG